MEAQLTKLNSTQHLIGAAKEFYVDAPPAPLLHPAGLIAARWQIVCAWRWLIRGPDKEALFSIALTKDPTKAIELEGPMDLAYRGVMPAALGRAI